MSLRGAPSAGKKARIQDSLSQKSWDQVEQVQQFSFPTRLMPVWKFQNYITDDLIIIIIITITNQNKLTKIMEIELLIKIGMQLLMRSSISAYDGEWSSLLLKISIFCTGL